MELQERYIVIKYKDLCRPATSDHHSSGGELYIKDALTEREIAILFNLCKKITKSRLKRGKKEIEALVIEKDWPEYKPTLALLSARVDKALDPVTKAILIGLTTDGAHHKQWALEQAFRALCMDDYVDRAKSEFQWSVGIAP